MNLQDYNVVFPHMTSMTREAVATVGLDPKAASKCKNMFALGICFCIYNRPLDHAVDFIRRKFAKKPAVAEANVLALKGGYNYASNTHAFANTYVAAGRFFAARIRSRRLRLFSRNWPSGRI